jgi:hypothetical protein
MLIVEVHDLSFAKDMSDRKKKNFWPLIVGAPFKSTLDPGNRMASSSCIRC